MLHAECKIVRKNHEHQTSIAMPVSDSVQYVSTDTFYKVKQQLSGNWTWLKTECCGRIKKISTPENTQTNIEKKFSMDGSVTTLVNGKIQNTLGYQILFSYLKDDNYMISIDDGRPGILHFFADTMIIDYGYVDLQTEWYLRKKK
jgi:hypothetical protein